MNAKFDTPTACCPERAAWALPVAAAAAIVANMTVGSGLWGGLLAALAPVLFAAFFAALLCAIRADLSRRAEAERTNAAAPAAQGTSRLFDDGDEIQAAPLSDARALGQFDRLAGFAAAPVLAFIQAGGVLLAFLRLRAASPAILEQTPWSAVVALGVEAFVFFVAARSMLAWSRAGACPGLRLAGQYAGFACAACAVMAVAFVLPAELRPVALKIVEWWLAIALAVAAFESAGRFIASLYRGRGSERDPVWNENFVAGFFAEPSTWRRRLRESLDYQFGFAVSGTWAFRLIARAALPFALFVAVLLYLSSSFVFLGPEESAVLERFGRPAPGNAVLAPGFHLVRPWPFETVRRFPAKRIQTFSVGVRLEPGEAQPRVILWDVPHYRREEYVLVAGRRDSALEEAGRSVPANLLVVNIPVEFMVTNLHQFLYVHVDPSDLLCRIASRAVTLEAAGRDLFGFFGQGQLATAGALRKAIQAEADRLELGTRIVFVGLQSVHPPVPVAPAFQQVVGAVEEREAAVTTAKGYARRLLPMANAGAGARLYAAEAEARRRSVSAEAESDLFCARAKSDAVAPGMFRSRILLDSLEGSLARARKILVAVEPGREVVSLNLESRLSRDLFDFALGTNAPTGDTRP